VRSLRGESEVAVSLAHEAVTLAAASDSLTYQGDCLLTLADVQHRAGRTREAVEAATAARALYGRKGDLASVDRADGVLRTVLGVPPA
jgi:hypothetical protein